MAQCSYRGSAMRHVDVGKDAKHRGSLHPKNVPLPADRPTPGAAKRLKPEKNFGFTYERAFWKGKWEARRRWFKTERQRDQAFEKEAQHQAKWGPTHGILRYRNLTKVQR